MNPESCKRVLIVDDETDLAAMVALRLGAAGFRTATACDGLEALDRIKTFRPDAAVVDVSMPRLDGWGFCARLRDRSPGIPIIIFTAWLSDDLKRRARAAGAAEVILKPFDDQALIGALQRLTENGGAHSDPGDGKEAP